MLMWNIYPRVVMFHLCQICARMFSNILNNMEHEGFFKVITNKVKILTGKPTEKYLKGSLEVDGKIILDVILEKWVYLAQDSDYWRSPLNEALNLRIL